MDPSGLHLDLSAAVGETRLRRQMIALQRVGAAVWTEPELERVLLLVVEEARHVTEAQYGALGVESAPGQPFSPWVFSGIGEDVVRRIGRSPRAVGLLGEVVRSGRTVRSDDLRTDPRACGMPPHHPEMTTFLGVPISAYGRSVGNLYLTNKRGGESFTDEDVRFVELLAQYSSVAVEIAALQGAIVREQEARSRADVERTRLLGLLSEEQRWLRGVIGASPVGIVLVEGAEAPQLTANAEAELLLGALDPSGGPDQLAGRLLRPDGTALPPAENPVAAALRGERVLGLSVLARPARGARPVPVLVNATPIDAEDGRRLGAVMTLADVSPLRALARLREEWTSVVAHELRQPVSAISTLAALLARRTTDPSVLDLATRITGNTGALGRIIADLTDASLLEAGSLRFELQPLDLAAAVRTQVAALEGQSEHPIVVETAPVPEVVGDAVRLGQVLSNLLSNAVRHGAPASPIVVRVAATDGAVSVEVENAGPPLPPGQEELIFERYNRGAGRSREGLGLGLYVARRIVEAHGGRIRAENVPGGVRFLFTVPVRTPA